MCHVGLWARRTGAVRLQRVLPLSLFGCEPDIQIALSVKLSFSLDIRVALWPDAREEACFCPRTTIVRLESHVAFENRDRFYAEFIVTNIIGKIISLL